MNSIWLGRTWDPKTGRTGAPVRYDKERHLILFGPNGSGKGASLEIPNLLQLAGLSIVSIDPKGQNCAVTLRWRSRVSRVVVLNPFGVLGLPTAGFNPLARLAPNSPRLYDPAQAIADALIKVEGDSQPHFPESARGLLTWLIMWEVIDAARNRRMPSLAHVRDLLTEPVETAIGPDGRSYAVRGLCATAGRAVASGDPRVAGLAARFTVSNREIDSIVSTADTQTRWLMSEPMRQDITRDGIDFAQLKREPTTVYVILPANELEGFSVWLRLIVVSALNALYQQGGMGGLRTLFLLSEFAQLGHLKPISAALGQGRGYGVQLFPVLQDINQLRGHYGRDHAETFLGMSGATFAFTPNDGETAEWMSKRSGERRYVSLNASDDPNGPDGMRVSYQEKRERRIPPDAMFGIPEFHGLVWYAGQSEAQPVIAPPYWEMPECRGRYDPDPYHQRRR